MTLNTANGTYDHQTDYTILGDYEIEIWVIDENGQATQYQDTVTISDSEPPVADAGVDQQITVGTQVTLEGTGSSDNYGIANYTWEFNDNGLKRLYGETPQYTFNSPGAYQITLRVRDFGGNTNEAKTWVNVSSVTNTGTVIGTAVDEDDNPVAGVTVYVEAYPSIQNETDSLGRFVLEGVPIGDQKIIFIKDGFERDSEDVFVEPDQTTVTGDETLARSAESQEETPLGLFAAVIAIIAIIIALLFFLMTKKKPVAVPEETVIDEVFLMYNDGRLIKHFTRRLKPDMDEDILSSMLVAVQDFVKDSFRDQEGMLDEMNFGRFQVLLGRGEHIILATIVLGDDPEHLKKQVTQCVNDIEEKYADVLEDWDGDMQSLKGSAKYVMDLIDGNYAKET
jgi:PKD repeat protein